MANDRSAIMIFEDRPRLAGHSHAGQINNDRIRPTAKPHRAAGVRGHRELTEGRFVVAFDQGFGRGERNRRGVIANDTQRTGDIVSLESGVLSLEGILFATDYRLLATDWCGLRHGLP